MNLRSTLLVVGMVFGLTGKLAGQTVSITPTSISQILSHPIRYELIFDETKADSAQIAKKISQWGGKIEMQYKFVMRVAFPLSFNKDSLVTLKGLVSADYDQLVSFPQNELSTTNEIAPPWGVQYIKAPQVWANGNTGQGVIVGIMDSGIDSDHPGLNIAGGRNFTSVTVPENWDDNISACNGHGTHVAGTVAGIETGVAPGSLVYALKVFEIIDGNCRAWTSSQVAALNFAKDNNIKVVNSSIGGSYTGSYEAAVLQYAKTGGIFVGASGNQSASMLQCPACYDFGTAVASVNSSGFRSGFSNRGYGQDIAAPGEGIFSTMPGGGYGNKSGTSMASPHVAGVAALLKARKPTLTVQEFHNIIAHTATDAGTVGRDVDFGYGIINAFKADSFLKSNPNYTAPLPTFVTSFPQIKIASTGSYIDSVRVNSITDAWEPVATPSINGIYFMRGYGTVDRNFYKINVNWSLVKQPVNINATTKF